MKPIVTLGICVKNCAGSIKEAINSILDQSFPHEFMEVIFVDDGSEDRTLSIIMDFIPKMDMSIKVFHSEWRGLGAARNVVVNNANGKYIIWVDGDTILPKDHVSSQVKFMECNPGVGIAKGKYGVDPKANLVATLESMGWMVDSFKYGGKTSELPGTAGSIYRLKAIRHVGGFDNHIRGAGEDTDAAYRIREAGWLLYITQAEFYERRKETWKSLWDKYFWYGYGLHSVLHKNKGVIAVYKMVAPASFLNGLLHSFIAYKLTRRKVAFLLPLQYVFKMTAWCLGFAKSHIESYRHV